MTDRGIFDLKGKVALVTAGGHGLGREYCVAMAEFGAHVICSDIDLGLAQETVEIAEQYGNEAMAIQGDASKPDEIEAMVTKATGEFRTIDILFCNAGIVNPFVPIHELAIDDWDRVMAVNLRGTFLCMRAVIPVMLKQKRGSIICTASVVGIAAGATPDSAPYGASKAGMISLVRHTAVAYAKQGIRVNAIAPGFHDTKPVASMNIPPEKAEESKKFIVPFIPMGRWGKPSELKGLAVFLGSDASSYVTGQVFVQDGGYLA